MTVGCKRKSVEGIGKRQALLSPYLHSSSYIWMQLYDDKMSGAAEPILQPRSKKKKKKKNLRAKSFHTKDGGMEDGKNWIFFFIIFHGNNQKLF